MWGKQIFSVGTVFSQSGDLFFRKNRNKIICGDNGNIVWGNRKQPNVSVGTNKILCGVWGAPHTSFFSVGSSPHKLFVAWGGLVCVTEEGVCYYS